MALLLIIRFPNKRFLRHIFRSATGPFQWPRGRAGGDPTSGGLDAYGGVASFGAGRTGEEREASFNVPDEVQRDFRDHVDFWEGVEFGIAW